ncbi:SprT-like domain-containing protein [Thermodesulfobacteriota bacterium]
MMSLQKDKAILIQEKLERNILHGLACEWEDAIRILNFQDREKFRKPFFSLRDMKGKWGCWSSGKNEIGLSRNLVFNHSWDTVREVLLHEMAHQLSEQFFGNHNEPPHGPKFKKACYLLRANPRASGDYQLLDERVLQDSSGPEDKIMFRVKKLMALAQSKNQYEAEAAMAKAHEFIAKYNIDLLSRDEDRDFISVFVGSPALRHFREVYHLANLLQDFYFVHAIWVPAYVLEKSKMGNVLEISGTAQNIKIAGYVHDFIKRYIDSQWQKYNKDKKLNRYRKTDFAVGVMEGFHSKLEAQTSKEERIKEKFGLIKIEDPLLQKHIKYKYPHTATVRGNKLRMDRKVLRDGIGVGRELVISKGITERKAGRRLLSLSC